MRLEAGEARATASAGVSVIGSRMAHTVLVFQLDWPAQSLMNACYVELMSRKGKGLQREKKALAGVIAVKC